jgi:hypothetical protein
MLCDAAKGFAAGAPRFQNNMYVRFILPWLVRGSVGGGRKQVEDDSILRPDSMLQSTWYVPVTGTPTIYCTYLLTTCTSTSTESPKTTSSSLSRSFLSLVFVDENENRTTNKNKNKTRRRPTKESLPVLFCLFEEIV